MRFGAQPDARRRSSTRRCTSAAVEPVDHCVFMGMGEPMLNLDNVLAACERLPDLGITPPPHGDLDRRLDPRHRAPGRVEDLPRAPRALAARGRRGAALASSCRSTSATRWPTCSRPAARFYARKRRDGVRRVRDARGRQRPLRAGARARRRCSTARDLQGQPDPLQPDRTPYEGSSRAARSTRSAPRSSSTGSAPPSA